MNPITRWAGLPVAAGLSAGVGAAVGVVPLWGATLVGAFGLMALAAAVGVASAQPSLRAFGDCIDRGRHAGRAALTFDDGPDPVTTLPLLAVLAGRGATATFFVLADRVEAWPDLVRAMLAGGHEVALHGRAHHAWLTTWSPARGARDLRVAVGVLAAVGVAPRYFRPPFGVVSPRLYAAVALVGLPVAWCSVRTRDGSRIDAETLRARCRAVVGTDIVLLHEGRPLTLALIGDIIDEWGTRGIAATTLSQALEADA